MNVRVATATGLIMALLVAGQAQEPKTFGAGVSLTETTPLTHILDRPADFEGKTVRVEGIVKAVRADGRGDVAFALAAAHDGRTVLIKVDDGVIIFPVSAKDRRAVAQGVVERIAPALRLRRLRRVSPGRRQPFLPARQRRGRSKRPARSCIRKCAAAKAPPLRLP